MNNIAIFQARADDLGAINHGKRNYDSLHVGLTTIRVLYTAFYHYSQNGNHYLVTTITPEPIAASRTARTARDWLLRFVILSLGFATFCWLQYMLEPYLAYERVYFRAPSYTSLFKSGLLIIVLTTCVKTLARKPSDLILWILATFLCIPQIALAACNPIYPESVKWEAATIETTALVILRIIVSQAKLKKITNSGLVLKLKLYQQLIFVLSFFSLLAIVIGYTVSSLNLDWLGQYQRRISFRFEESPFLGAGYLFTWLGGVFEPILLAIGILWKKKAHIFLAIAIAVISFSLNGAKSSAFSWILCLFVIAFTSSSTKRFKSIPHWGFFLLATNLFPTLILYLFNNPFLALLIPRRLGIMPAQITIDYIHWSELNGYTFFTHNLLKWFLPKENRLDVAGLVGLNWTSTGLTNANANVWADAYVSMGIAGIFIIIIFMAVVLRIADNLSMTRNSSLVTSVMITTLVSWVNIAFSTSMVTNGILVALVLLKISPLNSDKQADSS